LSIDPAKILAKVLKIPALKNSNKLTLTSKLEFILVCVVSPSLAVMNTKNIEIMALNTVSDSEDITV